MHLYFFSYNFIIQMFQNLSKFKKQKDINITEIKKDNLLDSSQSKQHFSNIQKIMDITIECVLIDILQAPSIKQSFQDHFSLTKKIINLTKGINNHLFLQYLAIIASTSKCNTLIFTQTGNQQINLKKVANQNQLPSIDSESNIQQIISQSSFWPQTLLSQEKDILIKHIQKSSSVLYLKDQQSNFSKVELFILAQSKIEKLNPVVYKGTPKSKQDFQFRVTLLRQIAQSISYIHKQGFTFFPNSLEDIIFLTKNSHVKLSTHKFRNAKDFTAEKLYKIKEKQMSKMKKTSLKNHSLKFIAPQFLHKNVHLADVRNNDIWKFGLLLFSLLTGQQFLNELYNLESVQQNKLNDYKVVSSQKLVKVAKFLKESYKNQLLCSLMMDPSKRANAKQLQNVLTKIEEQFSEHYNFSSIEKCKYFYRKQQQESKWCFNLLIKQNEQILTSQLKKKVAEYFKKSQNRTLKNYNYIFRASQTKFSSRCFYQAVFQRKNILIVLLQKKEKKKILCYSQEAFDRKKCNGVFGGYVKDQKKLSFIYSPQENEFLKLKNSDKAIGVSLTHGPIFGEGDLVISDGAVHNTCRFPSSYESSSKVKRLLKSDNFQVEQYFVYYLTF